MMISGIPVIVNHLAEEITRKQVCFPRSRRRRIIKKWAKQDRYYTTIRKPCAYLVQGRLICHPTIYDQLQKELDSK
jgi:hypothetical protein